MITNKPGFRLVRCDVLGRPTEPISDVAATFIDHARGAAELYQRVGFSEPWVFYAAVWNGHAVGGGAFMGAPINGEVEIAFFTLGPYSRQGFATDTARRLLGIAHHTEECPNIVARSQEGDRAAARILRRLRFRQRRRPGHSDRVIVWEHRTRGR